MVKVRDNLECANIEERLGLLGESSPIMLKKQALRIDLMIHVGDGLDNIGGENRQERLENVFLLIPSKV